MTKAQEFLNNKGLFNTQKLVNSFDEILTLTELLEEYRALDKPDVSGRSGQLVCVSCGVNPHIDEEIICSNCVNDYKPKAN